jgi:uncharacterized protein (TIGR00730 family)
MATNKIELPIKSYKNIDFLNSPDARIIRILSEFVEPQARFRHHGIRNTIVFFGSARIKSRKEAAKNLAIARREAARARSGKKALAAKVRRAEVLVSMSRYYDDAVSLARLLTKWSQTLKPQQRFAICSGGGPGVMEAANKGAFSGGGQSIGLNISLPFEQFANPYITKGLSLEFHYFFLRKFWFAYLAKALVVFPGGFGTLDELMEILTLLQTGKIKKKMTVIIYGSEYWNKIIKWDELVAYGVVLASDLKLFRFADTPHEAFELMKKSLSRDYHLD